MLSWMRSSPEKPKAAFDLKYHHAPLCSWLSLPLVACQGWGREWGRGRGWG